MVFLVIVSIVHSLLSQSHSSLRTSTSSTVVTLFSLIYSESIAKTKEILPTLFQTINWNMLYVSKVTKMPQPAGYSCIVKVHYLFQVLKLINGLISIIINRCYSIINWKACEDVIGIPIWLVAMRCIAYRACNLYIGIRFDILF